MGKTKIEWCDRVWNPVTGCSKVSEGCRNCYAETVANVRFAMQYPPVIENGVARDRIFTDVQCHSERLEQPLHWRKPQRIFVNSMSDLFHEDVPDSFIADIFGVMAAAQEHTFQVLTKRPKRMKEILNDDLFIESVEAGCAIHSHNVPIEWPLPSVWLGVSVENRATLHRIDDLRATPAAVRFLSLEPLLEDLGTIDLTGIHWVIVGGESGHGARPFDLAWGRSLIKQCRDAGTAVFMKQLGSKPVYEHIVPGCSVREFMEPLELNNSKGGDWNEWPEDLRVREFPEGRQQ